MEKLMITNGPSTSCLLNYDEKTYLTFPFFEAICEFQRKIIKNFLNFPIPMLTIIEWADVERTIVSENYRITHVFDRTSDPFPVDFWAFLTVNGVANYITSIWCLIDCDFRGFMTIIVNYYLRTDEVFIEKTLYEFLRLFTHELKGERFDNSEQVENIFRNYSIAITLFPQNNNYNVNSINDIIANFNNSIWYDDIIIPYEQKIIEIINNI
jgi:hypothetical protein